MKQIDSWRIEFLKCEGKGSAKSTASPPNSFLLMATDVRTAIASCATSGYSSILQRWDSLLEDCNSLIFYFYHDATLVCVLENFNCIFFDG